MALIERLNDHLTNMIAAGEVIERIASVVKELIENSIDAEAKNITITLVDSGLKEIVVKDDGFGMDSVDAKRAILPHSTSKLIKESDLFNISTLGFRGEALPSIVSVSNFKMKTSNDGNHGLMYTVKGGEIVSEALIAFSQGTEITVRNFFYNTPARLQNLKSENTELSFITDYVSKIALARPDISFKLINNEKILLHSYGNNNLLAAINNIYGPNISKSMIDFFGNNGLFQITGYISKINETRSSKNNMTIIVNGRTIRNNKILNAIVEGYQGYLMIGKYPIAVIAITVDYSLVDVNVHPGKLEVRFTDENKLTELITSTIASRLSKTNMVIDKNSSENEEKVLNESNDLNDFNESLIDKNDLFDINKFNERRIKTYNLDDFKESLPYENEEAEERIDEIEKPSIMVQDEFSFVNKENESIKDFLPRLEYIGQLFGTYILSQSKDEFYLIDQHAAAERVNYEKFRTALKKEKILTYELLVPIQITYAQNEYLLVLERMKEINALGIKIEDFGNGSFLVREVPIWLFKGKEKEFIDEIIYLIISDKKTQKHEFLDNMAKSLACKKSIKGNQFISKQEVLYLFEDLQKCENPYTCPHGRPVIIRYKQEEIEKWFKRIV
ncbi:MAG: DNA mismatch repair endonuclease MutL [Bacilli bacterium]|nr:DNA mismatch repair endonuclease MutL [Bacilli bacterium]MDD3121464.1 DNA mismatch repair endonuclease MutL [Bacilli bacterium]